MIKINFNTIDKLEDLLINIEKTDFMLQEFKDDYASPYEPDAKKALEWLNEISFDERSEDTQAAFSAKWFMEYLRIQQLIEIANDYNVEALQLIREIREEMQAAKEPSCIRSLANNI